MVYKCFASGKVYVDVDGFLSFNPKCGKCVGSIKSINRSSTDFSIIAFEDLLCHDNDIYVFDMFVPDILNSCDEAKEKNKNQEFMFLNIRE